MKKVYLTIALILLALSACGTPAPTETLAQPTDTVEPIQPTNTAVPTQIPSPFQVSVAEMFYEGTINAVDFSPDGNFIITSGCSLLDAEFKHFCAKADALVWSAMTGEVIASFTHNGGDIVSAFSPDGKQIVSGGCDELRQSQFDCKKGSAKVWDIATEQEIAHLEFSSTVDLVGFSPDGKYIFSGTPGGYFDQARYFLWSVNDEKPRVHLEPDYPLGNFSYSLDGKLVTSPRGLVRIWSAEGVLTAQYKHTGASHAAFSPDGKFIVSSGCGDAGNSRTEGAVACTEGSVHVWSVEAGKEVASKIFPHVVTASKFSSDGKYVITGGCDEMANPDEVYECTKGSARVWMPETGEEVSFAIFDDYVDRVTISPDGKYAAAGSTVDSNVIVWLLETGEEVTRMVYPTGVNAIAFSPNGKLFATVGCEEGIYLGGKSCYARVWLVEPSASDVIPAIESAPEPTATSFSTNPTQSITETAGLKSGSGTATVNLKFVSKTDQVVKLNWVNFEGAEEPFSEISPGVAFELDTYETHAWRLRDASGNLLFEYTATSQPIQEITINADLSVTAK